MRTDVDAKRFRYLLGLCSHAEREEIESEYFQDEAAFQQMLTAEDDLIDAYARGALSDEERRRFEKHFLTSLRGKDRVQFARALAVTIPASRSVRATLQITAIAAVIVVAVVLSWFVVKRTPVRNETDTSRSAVAEETRAVTTSKPDENPPAPVEKARSPKRRTRTTQQRNRVALASAKNDDKQIPDPEARRQDMMLEALRAAGFRVQLRASTELRVPLRPPTVPTVTLVPLRPRTTSNSYPTRIGVPQFRNSIVFRLSLQTAAQHVDYRATLKTREGVHVIAVSWTTTAKPSDSIDTPAISTASFPTGSYVLLLSGKKPDGSFVPLGEYSFQLLRN